jgi:hypothetical protein
MLYRKQQGRTAPGHPGTVLSGFCPAAAGPVDRGPGAEPRPTARLLIVGPRGAAGHRADGCGGGAPPYGISGFLSRSRLGCTGTLGRIPHRKVADSLDQSLNGGLVIVAIVTVRSRVADAKPRRHLLVLDRVIHPGRL